MRADTGRSYYSLYSHAMRIMAGLSWFGQVKPPTYVSLACRLSMEFSMGETKLIFGSHGAIDPIMIYNGNLRSVVGLFKKKIGKIRQFMHPQQFSVNRSIVGEPR